MNHASSPRRLAASLLAVLLGGGTALLSGCAAPGRGASPLKPLADSSMSERFEEVEQLVRDQEYVKAREKVIAIRDAARSAGRDGDLARALVRESQILTGQGQFETAADLLLAEKLPADKVAAAAIELERASVLSNYLSSYSWEIRKRERVSEAATSVRTLSADQLQARVIDAFLAAWKERAALGAVARGTFYDVLDPNDYPESVRGTVRDSLSYVFADTLANNSWWTPKQTRTVYSLPVDRLLDNDAEWRAARFAAGAEAHPLELLAAVLGDLEAWHAAEKQPAATLEARRVRAEKLAAAFERDGDKRLVREDLGRRLPAFRRDSWWTMGMKTLAEMTREEAREESWAEARALARSCAEAYPESFGGKACAGLQRDLERGEMGEVLARRSAPAAEGAAGEGGLRPRIEIETRNLQRLHLRAYAVDVVARLAAGNSPWPDYQEVQKLRSITPAKAWTVDPPPTPKLRLERSTFDLPLGRGAWMVVVSMRADFSEKDNIMRLVPMVLGDLALLGRGGNDEVGVIGLSGATGTARQGVAVEVYRNDYRSGGWQRVATGKSGEDGFAPLANAQQSAHTVLARQGADLALLDSFAFPGAETRPTDVRRTLVFTDRAVYRPGQTVYWKALLYHGLDGNLEPARGASAVISLLDPNGETVASATVASNEFGTASGEFAIPPSGRLLGAWTVSSSQEGQAQVRVEEYKRPTFEVEVRDPESALRLNQLAHFVGSARYYFGLPVSGGDATWRVYRELVTPLGWRCRCWGWWMRPAREEIVASGESRVAADGTFPVDFTPAADDRLADDKAVSYRYRIETSVTDEGGETRDAKRSFRLGFAAVEARFEFDRGLQIAGEAREVTLHRTDLSGLARAGEGTLTVSTLVQPPIRIPDAEFTEGQPTRRRGASQETAYDPASMLQEWADGPAVDSRAVRHAGAPLTLPLPVLPAGAYRVRYTTVDEFGTAVEARAEFVVAGPRAAARTPLALPLFAQFEEDRLEAGATAHLFVHSGLDEPRVLVEVYSDLELRLRSWVDTDGGSAWVDLPVRPEDRGGFTARVSTVREHRELALTLDVDVPWTDRRLDLSFQTFRDTLRPRARETWTVVVKDPAGKPVEAGAAEVLAAMYDRSLDVFAPHTPPAPLDLFPGRAGTPWAASSLGRSSSWWLGHGLESNVYGPFFDEDAFRSIHTWFGRVYGVEGGVAGGMVGGAPSPARARAASNKVGAIASMATAQASDSAFAEAIVADAAPPPEPPADAPAVEMRSDFRETAFWKPNLLTRADGSVAIEFEVPDSVTAWKVWLAAISRDFRSGGLEREARTVKELLVRPYLPRFLREGDRAEIAVQVNNSSKRELRGEVRIDITGDAPAAGDASRLAEFGLDARSARQPFVVAPGGGATVTFPLQAPRAVGSASIRVEAVAGDLSDGELRPLPVLPSRLHLAQSRFAMLKGPEKRELVFDDLVRSDDASLESERLVVTIDGQLFYSLLDSLPYLIEYPYECSEQTLNRFLSTGILSSLFERYPAVGKMAAELAKRETRYEAFGAAADPNRRITLEETPWLQQSRGNDPAATGRDASPLINVLDPQIALAQRRDSLARLEELQLDSGAFPWFPGGPPSDYMTLYVLYGFAKAREFQIDVPQDVVIRGWTYLAARYRDEWMREMKDHVEFLTLLNYVASSYPEAEWTEAILRPEERRRVLDLSFENWRRMAPGMKGLLALTLKRAGRPEDARKVYASVMDAAKTTRDEGTFWAPEERSWLWFNDTIEGHAFVLRVLAELQPDDPRRQGMIQWLFLNKKLNHWKSTRATAEVLYAVAYSLDRDGDIEARQEATVGVGGRSTRFVFEPDRYTGKKNQVVLEGGGSGVARIGPAEGRISIETPTKGQLIASATWHFATDRLPTESSGDLFRVERRYFRRLIDPAKGEEMTLEPLVDGAALSVGDEVEVQLSIRARQWAEYVHLRDPRPAGFEPGIATSGHRWDLGIGRYEEVRDSGHNFFFDYLPAGEYTLKYRVRAATAGTFRSAPAQLQSMYAPEFTAYSSGREVRISPR